MLFASSDSTPSGSIPSSSPFVPVGRLCDDFFSPFWREGTVITRAITQGGKRIARRAALRAVIRGKFGLLETEGNSCRSLDSHLSSLSASLYDR